MSGGVVELPALTEEELTVLLASVRNRQRIVKLLYPLSDARLVEVATLTALSTVIGEALYALRREVER